MKTRTRKRTKRKLLTLLLSLSMLMCYVPQVAVAEDVNWTDVSTGDKLRTAVENGGNIKLTKDIFLGSTLFSDNKEVTLDLNGHTITFSNEGSSDTGVYSCLCIINGSKWTIKDTSKNQTGKITGEKTGNNDNNGWVYISRGAISKGGSSVSDNGTSNSSVTLQSGTLEKGISIWEKGSFTITGGKVLGTVECSGTIYADGGTIGSSTDVELQLYDSSHPGTIARHADAIGQATFLCDCRIANGTISAGIFKGKVNKYSFSSSTTGYIKGGTFYCEVYAVDKVVISGGTFYNSLTSLYSNYITISNSCKLVTYQSNGNAYAKQVVQSGGTATNPDNPTRAGYIFGGWYTTSGCNTAFNFDSAISADTTIYAKWTECDHTGSTNQPTCTEPATCSICSGTIAALGHSDTDNDHICNTCTEKISECSGGTATCQKKAECATCGKEYGEKDLTNHTSKEGSWLTDSTQHAWKHSCCGTIDAAVNHNGGTANCQNKAVCKDCGVSYGDLDLTNHAGQLGEWQTSETEHWKIWSCCSAEANKSVHEYAKENTDAKYLKSAANCKNAAVYYRSCECGYTDPATAATFTDGNVNADKHVDENNDNKCDLCSKTISSSSGGSSGGGGGGSAGGGGAVAPSTTDNVTNKTETTATGTEKVTNADVSSKTTTKADGSKTTTTTVDTKTADKIVEKAVENKSETVVIDAASSTGNTGSSSSSASGQAAAEVAIPASTVTQLSEKTDAAVTIKTDVAEVTLDQKAVAAIAAAVETKESGSTVAATGEVKVIVTTTANTKSAVKLDVKIETANGEVKNLKGGSVSVTVKLNSTLASKKLACVYIDDRGIYHKVKGQKNANNTFTFKTL